jgi:hypothetical protein
VKLCARVPQSKNLRSISWNAFLNGLDFPLITDPNLPFDPERLASVIKPIEHEWTFIHHAPLREAELRYLMQKTILRHMSSAPMFFIFSVKLNPLS